MSDKYCNESDHSWILHDLRFVENSSGDADGLCILKCQKCSTLNVGLDLSSNADEFSFRIPALQGRRHEVIIIDDPV